MATVLKALGASIKTGQLRRSQREAARRRGARRIAAHPYMRPAADEVRPRFVQLLQEHVQAGINRVLKESKVPEV